MPAEHFTPKRAIRIAVIDSGINADHPHVGNVIVGVGFHSSADGKPICSPDVSDRIGHGTAIAGVIHWWAPEAVLCPVRIFDDKLEAPGVRLLSALEWAIDNGIDLIHLSLGLRAEQFKPSLLEICQRAEHRNILIVAASRAKEEPVYPAAFDTVIGVYDLSESGMNDLVHDPYSPVEFGAHPRPRPLPGLPQHLNFRGASFAAAHVTGMAAAILCGEPDATPHTIRRRLKDRAAPLAPPARSDSPI